MDAQVIKRSLDDVYKHIDDCAARIHIIRARHWSDSTGPEHKNFALFTKKRREDMKVVAKEISSYLESLGDMPLSKDSRDPDNGSLNRLFEDTWLLGIRHMAVSDPNEAKRMLGIFKQGRRSFGAITRAHSKLARGALSFQADDGA